jgi:hypothetical protein
MKKIRRITAMAGVIFILGEWKKKKRSSAILKEGEGTKK